MDARYAITGTGNGGQALAGDMALRGISPSVIYDIDSVAIESIKKRGESQMSAPLVEGFAEIKSTSKGGIT